MPFLTSSLTHIGDGRNQIWECQVRVVIFGLHLYDSIEPVVA